MTTFNPSEAPSIGSGGNHKFRIREANFGDGYSQTAGDGINTLESTVTLQWNNITTTLYDELYAFFVGLGGYQSFEYTLPNGSTAYQWKCKQFSDSWGEYNRRNFTATIERSYDI